MASSSDDVQRMPLEKLKEECQREFALFRRRHEIVYVHTYEILRRAFCEGDEEALAYIDEVYRDLFITFVHRHARFKETGEDAEYLVNGVLFSMWHAFVNKRANAPHPDWFAEKFPNERRLFGYLRTCVNNIVLEYLDSPPQILIQLWTEPPTDPADDWFDRGHFWSLVDECLQDENQRLVIHLSVTLKPREIYEKYPERFGSVEAVRALKNQAMRRLRGCRALRNFLDNLDH